ncbi:MAG: hypothetical protein WEE67_04465 [Chloroflexota bacterium]
MNDEQGRRIIERYWPAFDASDALVMGEIAQWTGPGAIGRVAGPHPSERRFQQARGAQRDMGNEP